MNCSVCIYIYIYIYAYAFLCPNELLTYLQSSLLCFCLSGNSRCHHHHHHHQPKTWQLERQTAVLNADVVCTLLLLCFVFCYSLQLYANLPILSIYCCQRSWEVVDVVDRVCVCVSVSVNSIAVKVISQFHWNVVMIGPTVYEWQESINFRWWSGPRYGL